MQTKFNEISYCICARDKIKKKKKDWIWLIIKSENSSEAFGEFFFQDDNYPEYYERFNFTYLISHYTFVFYLHF